MPDKKAPLNPAPGPKRHPEIPDSVHDAADKVARNLLNSPSKTSAQIVAERRETYGKDK